jgi:predicted transcriptional regulator
MDEKGVTNEALADAMRVSIGAVSKYLKGGGIGGELYI